MSEFDEYHDRFSSIAMRRDDGILEVRLHTDGGPLRWAGPAIRELATAFRAIAQDPGNVVVVLTGTGDEFSGPRPDPGVPFVVESAEAWEAVHARGMELMDSVLSIQAPVIAAVNGPALRHCELPLMSDIVICTPDAEFQDSGHIPNGQTPGDGINVLMPAIMGLTRARHFFFTGHVVTADEALSWGLVNEIVPRDRLHDRAWELARMLRLQRPMVLRHSRLVLTHELRRRMNDVLGYGLALQGLEVLDMSERLRGE